MSEASDDEPPSLHALPRFEPAMRNLLQYLEFNDIKSLRQTCRRMKNFIDRTREVWTEDISPLHLAARYDDVDMAVNSITHGFQLEQKITGRDGFPMQLFNRGTPLHVAAFYSANQVLRVLLDAGANKDAKSTCYGTAIQITIEVNNEEGFLLLMAADPRLKGTLLTCARLGRTQYAEYILNSLKQLAQRELDPRNVDSPLFVACQNGFYHLARLFIERGSPLVAGSQFMSILGTYRTPLIAACENGHVSIAKLLMDSGVSPDPVAPTYTLSTRDPASLTWRFKNSSPLFAAFKKEDTEMFNLLIARGAKISLVPYAPLFHQGMLHAMLKEVRYFTNIGRGTDMIWTALRARPIDINALDPEGDTVLHTLAKVFSINRFSSHHSHFLNLLDMLLQHGADKTLKNKEGKTPFDILFSSGGSYEHGVSDLQYSLKYTGFFHFLKTVYKMLL